MTADMMTSVRCYRTWNDATFSCIRLPGGPDVEAAVVVVHVYIFCPKQNRRSQGRSSALFVKLIVNTLVVKALARTGATLVDKLWCQKRKHALKLQFCAPCRRWLNTDITFLLGTNKKSQQNKILAFIFATAFDRPLC